MRLYRKLLKRSIFILVPALALGVLWWGLRILDPTSSAMFVSDSADGRYRCAVFCRDTPFGGNPKYEAGLFEGRWPHRELTGARAQWSHDSISSSDFRADWHPKGVDLNFSTGFGDTRATISGSDIGGSQNWGGEIASTPPKPHAAAFDLPIEDSFRLKAEGSTVVVGVIASGEITPGMEMEIHSQNKIIPVTVVSLEGGPEKPISSAQAGDRVGVLLKGVNKDQVGTGARLTVRGK